MARRLFRVFALHGQARPLLQCVLCRTSALRLPNPYTVLPAAHNYGQSGQQWNLHELVSQGRYSEALDVWEKAKEEGVADPALYSAVMRLAARLGMAEASRAVKEDMDRQGWSMDRGCALQYLQPLIKEGHLREAMDFIISSALKGDPLFVAESASLLLDSGHGKEAVDVCTLACHPSPPHSHPSPPLLVQLEALGSLGRVEEMRELVATLHPADRGVSNVPEEVELAVAAGLSLAGLPTEALELLKRMKLRSIPAKLVSVLMEGAKQQSDYTLAAEVFSLFWSKSMQKPSNSTLLHSPSSLPHHDTHHCKAVTAAIYLQSFAHRDIQDSGAQVSGRVAQFLEKNFYQELRDNSHAPTPQVYEALLLLGCYHSRAVGWADQAIKQCSAVGQGVPADAFTSWTRHCGRLAPHQALKVIQLVRVHRHHYNVDLGLGHYGDLLSIRYRCDSLSLEKEALDCIRAIKNSMGVRNMLQSTEAYNHLIRAVTQISVVGAHYTTYGDMLTDRVDPNLATFHLLMDGTLMEGSVKSAKRAAYFLWRSLMKEWPRVKPDIELINKFIQCCVVCVDHERAFVFLAALSDCGVDPNLETFTSLLKVCHAVSDSKGFSSVLALAHHCLPDQRTEVSALAHQMQLESRAEEDYSLAKDILMHLDTSRPL